MILPNANDLIFSAASPTPPMPDWHVWQRSIEAFLASKLVFKFDKTMDRKRDINRHCDKKWNYNEKNCNTSWNERSVQDWWELFI